MAGRTDLEELELEVEDQDAMVSFLWDSLETKLSGLPDKKKVLDLIALWERQKQKSEKVRGRFETAKKREEPR